ncbi:zinc-dependent metalloprotease [Cyclobacterium salsum]|uniref:zinc-dependent metalloprotease n=1 Tax=Cyclobacterium salsum TaxID=2666329 RepID=UPI001390F40D|nr:zinc-dependent metalloprotease [Cyclobacterium salsum]
MKNIVSSIVLIGLFMSVQTGYSQKKKNKNKNTPVTAENSSKKDSSFKEYSEVITSSAISDEGIFTVHKVDSEYYYEIPFAQFGDDMLWVTRISKIPDGFGGGYVNAGSKTNEQVVQWSRVDNSILLRSISYSNVANDSLPIHHSIIANNNHPIIASFEIEAFNSDSSAVVISVNNLFLDDNRAISGVSESMRQQYKVKALEKNRSFINRMASYPENVEVRHEMTYAASEPPSNSKTGTISLEVSQSMYLLPETPMQPRLYDKRVGWFTLSQVDYGSEALKADKKTYIRRWRLEPKDPEAYARGELVEPVKPIIYYLDPATPDRWKPFFIQGVKDWQAAFEVAGFKNAIIAKEAPTPEEDPDWSPEDARFSTIRYIATTTRNAMGPSVSDPRSGEIIESDIVWYHNHIRSYRNRYLLETGSANPLARTLHTPEAEIGEMMRMVIAHEVGHALGLPHNMKASHSYPTDSLRSATFTQKWGLAASIMDYTRYNYVAQPGDEGVRWVRMLGPYDTYAINWGYRVIREAESAADEQVMLNKWIRDKEGDPRYLFGSYNAYDPSSQTESVGDDPIKASSYGLSNLKIVAKNLKEWTSTPGEPYDDLDELYGELLGVWARYAGHVNMLIGGIYQEYKTTDQSGVIYSHIAKSQQQEALRFINKNVFVTPDWLLQDGILQNIEASGALAKVRSLQSGQLSRLLQEDKMKRMIENEALNGNEAYSLSSMLSELRKGIWLELSATQNIDAFRRNLQREHVVRLEKVMINDANNRSDISALARVELKEIQKAARSAALRYESDLIKAHLQDIDALVDSILDEE